MTNQSRRIARLVAITLPIILLSSCDSGGSANPEESGPRVWPYGYQLYTVAGEPVPTTVWEVRDTDCRKSTVYSGSLSFGLPKGSFKLAVNSKQTLCNREQVIESDGPYLTGKYSYDNGVLRLTEVEQFVQQDSSGQWPDYAGTLSADRNELKLLVHVIEDISKFPFLSRVETGATLEFLFTAHELF